MQSLYSATSLFTQKSLATARSLLAQSAERLSSGLRINRAKEDAAGLGISQELQRQTRSFAVAARNANDAISMVQTAEGAMQSISDMLHRLKELTTQGVNESLSKDQRSSITAEIGQLRSEINAVAERSTFNNLKLLTGDFSVAVRNEFVKATELNGTNNSVLGTSTVKLGVASAASVDTTKSRFSIADIQVDSADEGKYTLSNNGASLTLTRTVGNTSSSETLTLVGGTAGQGQVKINDTLNATMTLNFSKLGVSMVIKNEFIGSGDRSGSEIATKIAALGVTPNADYQNKGWKSVAGADWATGSNALKAIVTSTAGNIRLTSTAGITSVQGYNGAGSDGAITNGSWTDGSATVLAFTGSASQLNNVLKTLEVNNTTGVGEISVDIVRSDISVFTNGGVTSYYEVISPGSITWESARTAALGKNFNGLQGYLANLTSTDESTFIQTKLSSNGWIGASDDVTYVNAAIAARNDDIAAGIITGESQNLTLGVDKSYANQAAVEGLWYWIDGPEKGLQFMSGNSRFAWTSGGTGKVTTAYANWASGEPNNSGNENFAYAIGGGSWNDFPATSAVASYIVEYGGRQGDNANTSKTILIGTPGFINVGDAVDIKAVATSEVGESNADIGIYRLSADTSASTVTLKRFDIDDETLLGSETISVSEGLGAGQIKELKFERLGVALTLSNSADRSITLGDLESGLEKSLTVASSRMASLIGADGPTFQTGEASRNDFAMGAFKDMRLGKNTDGGHGALFNEVNDLILSMAASSDPATASFQRLENKVEDMITVVTGQRSDFGAIQNRLTAAINNINEQYTNLTAAKSQIQDTDFAWETARLTKLQIGQQAATAMLAQANAIPNVIMALIE